MAKTTPTPASASSADEIDLDIMQQAAARRGLTYTIPAKPAPVYTDGDGDTPPERPAREDGETDEDYHQRLIDAGFDPDEETETETDDERAARLQQQEDETDDDYEARLAEEGLTRDDVPTVKDGDGDGENDGDGKTDEQKQAEARAAAKAADAADLKKLPPETRKTVQSIIDRRLGKITAKSKADIESAQAERDAAIAERDEARAAAAGKPSRIVVPEGIHPLALTDNAAEIDAREAEIDAFLDWAEDHAEGYEPDEASLAKGHKPASAADIRRAVRDLTRERDRVLPGLRDALKARATHTAEARKLMPSLFDAKSTDYLAAQKLLREQPEIKRFPDYQLRLAWMVAGQKALAAPAPAKGADGKPTAPNQTATPSKKAPRVPNGGGTAKGGILERKPKGVAAPDAVKRFAKSPTRDNLAAVVGDLVEDA